MLGCTCHSVHVEVRQLLKLVLNINLPQIRTAWVETITRRTVLIAMVRVERPTQVCAAPAGLRSGQKDMVEERSPFALLTFSLLCCCCCCCCWFHSLPGIRISVAPQEPSKPPGTSGTQQLPAVGSPHRHQWEPLLRPHETLKNRVIAPFSVLRRAEAVVLKLT